MKSFSACVQDLMDAWIDSGDSVEAVDIYKAALSPMQPNVIMAVIDCSASDVSAFSAEFIRPYSVSTGVLDCLALHWQAPLNLQNFPDLEHFNNTVNRELIEVLDSKRPSLEKGSTKFGGCKIVYERLLIPQKSTSGRGEWCILLSKIDLLLPDVPVFHAEGIDLSILQLLTEGAGQKEIAIRLDLSPRTIEHRLERLKANAGARNLQHLVALWISSRL